ncbi:hypothetical protein IFM89_004504 [Coptis chinensis]|uniref:Uncharacterized protein n=1 Tax=Coptis chinensis TaxID=261450 RepID=A0A835GWY9_9MAGN|nr:hypothetical protein IFM89_004504 [Coptis chinensis]
MYDPTAVKLFGKTIPSPQSPLVLAEHTHGGKENPEASDKSSVLDSAKQDPSQEIQGMVDQLKTDCDGQVDTPDSAHHQLNSCDGNSTALRTSSGDGTVLKFGSDAPLCESMASVLNLGDQKRKVETTVVVSGGNGEEPSSCGSSVSASSCKIELPEDPAQVGQWGMRGCSDVPTEPPLNPLQCHPGQPLVYPWNSGWNSVPAIAAGGCSPETFYRLNGGDPKQVQWGSTSMVVAPTFCTPSIPFPFVPAAYWGCMGSGWAGTWSMPWTAFHGTQSPSSSSSRSGCSNSESPTLGKHSRDANIRGEGKDKMEKCLWVPKTLRIDHPDAAAKSSIWDTLSIKPSQSQPFAKGGIFKAFQPKTEVDDNASNAAQVLQANPAASSRSQAFQEST